MYERGLAGVLDNNHVVVMNEWILIVMGLILFALIIWWMARQWNSQKEELLERVSDLETLEKAENNGRLKEFSARKKAERSLATMHEFVNCIAYEMRDSLHAVSGFAQLLNVSADELAEDEKADLCNRIQQDTEELAKMVDKMIELSHYSVLTEVPRKDRILLNELCQKVVDEYDTKVNEDVELRLITNLPDHYAVQTNRECLKIVLRLLLDNAVRYTKQGHIDLTLSDYGHRERITFAVTDTGCGIPKDRQLTAFELYTRENGHLTSNGMGLNICKAVVRLLGGVIYVDPHYEGGARIIFDIAL